MSLLALLVRLLCKIPYSLTHLHPSHSLSKHRAQNIRISYSMNDRDFLLVSSTQMLSQLLHSTQDMLLCVDLHTFFQSIFELMSHSWNAFELMAYFLQQKSNEFSSATVVNNPFAAESFKRIENKQRRYFLLFKRNVPSACHQHANAMKTNCWLCNSIYRFSSASLTHSHPFKCFLFAFFLSFFWEQLWC